MSSRLLCIYAVAPKALGIGACLGVSRLRVQRTDPQYTILLIYYITSNYFHNHLYARVPLLYAQYIVHVFVFVLSGHNYECKMGDTVCMNWSIISWAV